MQDQCLISIAESTHPRWSPHTGQALQIISTLQCDLGTPLRNIRAEGHPLPFTGEESKAQNKNKTHNLYSSVLFF